MFTRTLLFDVAMNGFPGMAEKGVRDDIRHSSEAETSVQSTREREVTQGDSCSWWVRQTHVINNSIKTGE